MKPEEMTNLIEEMLGQLFTDPKANTYSELMTAAYNLWAFLRYDANCDYPAFELPKEGHFEF